MEIERIQLVKTLKVQRTGSEQQRRRRQAEEDFAEMLESTMEGEEAPEEPPAEAGRGRPRQDTVSLSTSAPPGAGGGVSQSDTLQLSLAQREAGSLRPSPADEAERKPREHRAQAGRDASRKDTPAKAPSEEEEEEHPNSVDTLA